MPVLKTILQTHKEVLDSSVRSVSKSMICMSSNEDFILFLFLIKEKIYIRFSIRPARIMTGIPIQQGGSTTSENR